MSESQEPARTDDQKTGWVVVGRIHGLFGVQGWLRLFSYLERPPDLLGFDRLWLVTQEGREARRVLDTERKGLRLVARLEGVGDRESARTLLGTEVQVPRSALPEAGEDEEGFLWADLLGLDVETVEGVPLGSVTSLVDTGANDVLVVSGEDRERLIPFLGDYVPEVDLERGIIRVDWDPDF
ncbi:ribosome maturation factor RimM [Thiohalorhabdus sp.]|uniref:ribosome maturation factor RimM n=1 Tax=Thiohalorhabdus sp. TaxID=3094134 RepID=UPI002FC36CCD